MMYWGGQAGAGDWMLPVIWTVLVVAVLVASVAFLAWWFTKASARSQTERTSRDAREILDYRLVGGELSLEQYVAIRAAINGQLPAMDAEDADSAARA